MRTWHTSADTSTYFVNNAGIFESATWDELDLELWQRVISVDLNGPMLMCKAFLPLMQGRSPRSPVRQ